MTNEIRGTKPEMPWTGEDGVVVSADNAICGIDHRADAMGAGAGVNWNSGTAAFMNFLMRSNVASSWPGRQIEEQLTYAHRFKTPVRNKSLAIHHMRCQCFAVY